MTHLYPLRLHADTKLRVVSDPPLYDVSDMFQGLGKVFQPKNTHKDVMIISLVVVFHMAPVVAEGDVV